MKKVSLVVLAITMSIIGMTQDFESKMLDGIQQLEQKTDVMKLSEKFEVLAKENPERFEAKYYTSLTLVFNAFAEKDPIAKEKNAKKAVAFIDQALDQNKKNVELYILKALCYQAMIQVDPIKRGYEYSQKAEKELAIAFELDKENPRYYFLKGQNVFYTPEQFGGGKANAKPYFEKANELFKTYKAKQKLDPTWGEKTNKSQLLASKK